MKYYVSKCHNNLNGKPYHPELETKYLCVNPKYPIQLQQKKGLKVIIDSGAFQDVKNQHRLSFEKALDRQLLFEKGCLGINAEAIVSYDRLVDEQFSQTEGQIKKRVSAKIAQDYVDETIEAARFLTTQRERLGRRKLILSCQGVSESQYLRCINEVTEITEPGDIIGLGGFCIISQSREVEHQYYAIIKNAFPAFREMGINRVHIFGLGLFRTLIQTDIYARMNEIDVSYDTSSPELNATMGRMFFVPGPTLSNVYTKSQKQNGYHPRDLALFNIKMINLFWDEIKTMELPANFIPSYEKRPETNNPSNNKFKGLSKIIQNGDSIKTEN